MTFFEQRLMQQLLGWVTVTKSMELNLQEAQQLLGVADRTAS